MGMRRRRIFWQIYIPFVLIMIVAFAVVALYTRHAVRKFHYDDLERDLRFRALLAGGLVASPEGLKSPDEVDAICKEFGAATSTRITVVLPDGRVIGDSERGPAGMDNHAGRPEIVGAMEAGEGRSVRFSETLRCRMMYLGLSIKGPEGTAGVLRVALPVLGEEAVLSEFSGRVVIASLLAVIASGLIAGLVSRRISLPFEEMRRSIMHYKDSGTILKLPIPDSAEAAAVAGAINSMVLELHDRMATVVRQGNEQRAILAGMQEGLLAVDEDGKILLMNRALLGMLGLEWGAVRGRSIQETLRNPDLHAFVGMAMESEERVEGVVAMNISREKRIFNAGGSVLHDADGSRLGVLVVLNDVTRMLKLERMRKDFVANVSHELKTPITSIKGFIETIHENPGMDRDKLDEFLGIVLRQADRLNALINDILVLSRLEFDAEEKRVEVEQVDLCALLRNAVETCVLKAREKSVSINLECTPGLEACVSGRLIEQAVVNLIDNAVKFSPEGGKVSLSAAEDGRFVRIAVSDKGCGIENRHLDRIFERFYRVDKARSRELGGTGLGLAIVKHIIIAHRGDIDVQSQPGKGSVFTLILPCSISAQ